jgi:hypothetical protein
MLIYLLQIEISQLQAGILFGAILGAVLGLVPLVLGIIKKKMMYGFLGFIGAVIGNAIMGLLLSVPIIAVCLYFIMRKRGTVLVSESGSDA